MRRLARGDWGGVRCVEAGAGGRRAAGGVRRAGRARSADQMSPPRIASSTTSSRFRAPSFRWMLAMWFLAVNTLMPSA